jgi:flagellar protein FlgJ
VKIDANTLLTQVQSNATQAAEDQEIRSFEEKLRAAAASGDKGALEKVASDFESLFVRQLMKTMRSSGATEGFIEKSHARTVFEEMLDEELADKIGGAKGLGIADMIIRYLRSEEEEASGGFDLKG